jgi:hypothetical protein
MPWKTNRSGCRLCPGCRIRRSTLGSSGSINAHSSSSTSHGFGRATQHPGFISPGVIQPLPGMLLADLSEDQRARLRQVLDGMLRERAGANGRAVLTNAVNIGIGTK